MIGVAYSWGLNNSGQLGTILEDRKHHTYSMKICNPKLMLPLKDTVIISVECGYSFTLAVTLSRQVLGWGDN